MSSALIHTKRKHQTRNNDVARLEIKQTRQVKISKQRALILMAFGIGAGLLSGMFGLGGGIIIVPGLMFALGMDQRRAHGTSLGGVFLISISSFFTYWTHDHIDWPVVLWLSIGSVAGSLIGATGNSLHG